MFITVFCILVLIYNQNFQTLNYILKRGTILEYSIPNDYEINFNEIENKLNSINIKYSYINTKDSSDFEHDYRKTNEKITEKKLIIGLAILARENKEPIFNNISDYIFDKYKNSKLKDIKSLNDNYHKPYSGFLKFVEIFLSASIIWLILLYLIYDFKTINQKIKENIKDYIKNKKEGFKKLIQKTRERGISYLIKRILSDDNKDDEEETSLMREIISTVVFVLAAVILIRYFIGELRWIPSGSMRTTIIEKDRVFVEKMRPNKEIKRGDILVFYPPSTELSNNIAAILARLSGIFCKDIAYIKRVVGLPGEKFEIKKDDKTQEYKVYINDEPLNEPYTGCHGDKVSLSYPYSNKYWSECLENMYCGPFVIPEDNYFMMGDNRCNSADSRFWGVLDKKRIIGRANFMFWPIDRINILKDYYLNLHKEKTIDGFKTSKYILNRYEFL